MVKEQWMLTMRTLNEVKGEMDELKSKLKSRSAHLGVIGLGYVGLPLAVEYGGAGFTVTGVDVDSRKAELIAAGTSYIKDVSSEDLQALVKKGLLKATTDYSVLASVDTVNICVPTPLRKTRDPDVSFIVTAVDEIAKYLHPGQLIILESTTYPGTTEELILPKLESTGLQVGKDFFLAFSPERVDPGNVSFTTKNIPKVVGGVTSQCTEVASTLYQQSLETVVPVSSTRVAEMVKLLENTFRSVNIALVNEIALMSDKMGIDVWEVIDAAATKPFGFMPFYPGPGLGGHCIPIDPFYLSWKAKLSGFEARFIELAGQVNSSMPYHVVKRVTDALNSKRKSVNGSKILIVGVAYKADIDDTRESPALDIIEILQEKNAEVVYTDPYVDALRLDGEQLTSLKVAPDVLKSVDCAVIATGHASFDYDMIVKHTPLLVDTRNVLRKYQDSKIFRL
jgi:UDP-N-acetyl-D-glucosamine dehydrogenase